MVEAASTHAHDRTLRATWGEAPRLDDFSPHLNQSFLVRLDAAELRLELVEASGFGLPEHAQSRGRGFSLVFRGPRGPVMPQGIHRFEHPALGGLDVFVVPIGPDDQGMHYQAVFNQV